MHISRVSCAKMAEDRPGQPAYEIFSIDFNHLSSNLLGSRSRPYGGLKFWYFFNVHYYFIARCTRLSRWQDCCYRTSRELASNDLFGLLQIKLVNSKRILSGIVFADYFQHCCWCYGDRRSSSTATTISESHLCVTALLLIGDNLLSCWFRNTVVIVSPSRQHLHFNTFFVM